MPRQPAGIFMPVIAYHARRAHHYNGAVPRERTVLAIGFALFVVYAFPGYMSTDSARQLWEGRSNLRGDSHPPIMAVEWKLLDLVISGPLLMLLAQGAAFLAGVYLLLRRAIAPLVAAWLACAVLLFPPVVATMAVIWKDSQMAAALALGTALLLDDRLRVRLGGLALLSAACAFRYNGFAAAVPIIGLVFVWRPGLAWWKRYAISGAAAIAAVALAMGVNRTLTVEHAYLRPAYADIVGVLTFTDTRSDDDLRYVLRGTPLRVTDHIQEKAAAVYSARNAFLITDGPDRMFDLPADDAQRDALDRAWKEIVASDWRAYFAYRLAGFRELLGWSDEPLFSPVYDLFIATPPQVAQVQHDASPSRVQAWIARRFEHLADDTPLFRPWIYAALALALLLLCARDRVTIALLASGLLYELSFFPAAGTPDTRYSHWLTVCACLCALILFAQRNARRSV